MTTIEIGSVSSSAAHAYENLADSYDVLTAGYCHDVWLDAIEQLALDHGLHGRRLLDLACGTGKSFLPLAERGYAVTACDISQAMVELARRKAPWAEVSVADMRTLGRLGEFDLITCLDDAVNYLLDEEELDGFFSGVARNLAANGVAVFDVNSLKLYRESFLADWVIDDPAAFIAWTATGTRAVASGDRVDATVHVFSPDGRRWARRSSRHEQRHWPEDVIERSATAASLRVIAVYGQKRGATIERGFGELTHDKALFFVTHEERR